MNDRGLYSCNLHHLYCHLYEMVRIQLNVTKSRKLDAPVAGLRAATLADLSAFGPSRPEGTALLGRAEGGVRGAAGQHRRPALHQPA